MRVCHNGSDFGGCVDGITGNRKFHNALSDIREWLNEGNRDEVILLQAGAAKKCPQQHHKVEKKLEAEILSELYRPEHQSYHGDLNSGNGCTEMAVDTITKQMVLDAGKNIIAFTSEGCQNDGGFNDLIFYAGSAAEDVNSVSSLQDWSDSAKRNKMSRVKDAVTKQRILSTKDTAKLKPSNISAWLDAD